jgi:hypothetical protein
MDNFLFTRATQPEIILTMKNDTTLTKRGVIVRIDDRPGGRPHQEPDYLMPATSVDPVTST